MKKNKLTTAVIAGLAGVAGVASVGNAVHVNPEGTGQVLIYPYYSLHNGLNTTYSVVNTTEAVKAIKVRFLEGKNSREVLDFNVYLSEYDVWTGVIGPWTSNIANGYLNHAGEDSGAHASSDNSCAPRLNKSLQEFLPYEIEKDFLLTNDPSTADLVRSREGHFEVLEMGEVIGAHGAAATHTSSGVPLDCGFLEDSWNAGAWAVNPNTDMEPATGGLFGAASIVGVEEGFNVSYDAVALQDFWPEGSFNHTNPGSLSPNIADGTTNSVVFNDGVALSSSWISGAQAVSAVFMRDEVYNEYNFESDVEGKSQWVVTFPTKYFHVNGTTIPPFTSQWDGYKACETFTINVWDREEKFNTTQGGISPPPPGGSDPQLCYEANTIEFRPPGGVVGDYNFLGANNLTSVEGVSGGTANGWARVNFKNPANVMVPANGTPYVGLPVAGFMVQRFTNNNAQPGLLAQYGGLFNHKGRVNSALPTQP
ncbi:hypothetical protein GCM10011365_11700 [Marinicella pacifica]|uniref:Uncharacterized protein n=1 Tax=Marinicella pacifica TaxID=1171543 RepID=A0A917FN13_9GAMM|nr:hypothetical protein [Marinicella pacifica]GGF92143.1 hypothetical protein GCM10011365_11700 [Marinicella pacifica]